MDAVEVITYALRHSPEIFPEVASEKGEYIAMANAYIKLAQSQVMFPTKDVTKTEAPASWPADQLSLWVPGGTSKANLKMAICLLIKEWDAQDKLGQ